MREFYTEEKCLKKGPVSSFFLFRRFGVEFEKKDIRQLWGTLLTDQKRMLEFSQFVRHFGGSLSDQGKKCQTVAQSDHIPKKD